MGIYILTVQIVEDGQVTAVKRAPFFVCEDENEELEEAAKALEHAAEELEEAAEELQKAAHDLSHPHHRWWQA